MGMPYTYSEICRNVAQLDDFGDKLNLDLYLEPYRTDPNITPEQCEAAETGGITKLPHRWHKVGYAQHGNLSPDIWEKTLKYKSGNTRVIQVNLLNTAQYEDLGDQEWVVFGDRRRSVERFLQDFNLTTPIARQKAVTQTI